MLPPPAQCLSRVSEACEVVHRAQQTLRASRDQNDLSVNPKQFMSSFPSEKTKMHLPGRVTWLVVMSQLLGDLLQSLSHTDDSLPCLFSLKLKIVSLAQNFGAPFLCHGFVALDGGIKFRGIIEHVGIYFGIISLECCHGSRA